MAETDELTRLFARILDALHPVQTPPRGRPLQQFQFSTDTVRLIEDPAQQPTLSLKTGDWLFDDTDARLDLANFG